MGGHHDQLDMIFLSVLNDLKGRIANADGSFYLRNIDLETIEARLGGSLDPGNIENDRIPVGPSIGADRNLNCMQQRDFGVKLPCPRLEHRTRRLASRGKIDGEQDMAENRHVLSSFIVMRRAPRSNVRY